jgi:hypothetical protein
VQITRISRDTQAGRSDWVTGSVYIDTVATPSSISRLERSGATKAGELQPGLISFLT